MACMENVCTNDQCKYYEMSNYIMKECPMCGSLMMNYSDEEYGP